MRGAACRDLVDRLQDGLAHRVHARGHNGAGSGRVATGVGAVQYMTCTHVRGLNVCAHFSFLHRTMFADAPMIMNIFSLMMRALRPLSLTWKPPGPQLASRRLPTAHRAVTPLRLRSRSGRFETTKCAESSARPGSYSVFSRRGGRAPARSARRRPRSSASVRQGLHSAILSRSVHYIYTRAACLAASTDLSHATRSRTRTRSVG